MRRTINVSFRAGIAVLLIVILSAVSWLPASASAAPMTSPAAGEQRRESGRIMEILESRTGDRQVADRLRKKLPLLTDRQYRLVAALCERIEADGGSTGAEIAFSIVTALIVLS